MNHTKFEEIRNLGIKTVIFDVDGTLFSLRKMHLLIGLDMLVYYLFRPWCLLDLFIIYRFRKNREQFAGRANANIAIMQYLEVANALKISSERVRAVIDLWMFRRPLRFLKICSNRPVLDLIDNLKNILKIKVVFFSDYPVVDKIRQLGLPTEYCYDASSIMINSLKPSTKGLEVIFKELELTKRQTLYIGDSDLKDGTAAKSFYLKYWSVDQLMKHEKASLKKKHIN